MQRFAKLRDSLLGWHGLGLPKSAGLEEHGGELLLAGLGNREERSSVHSAGDRSGMIYF